MNKIYNILSHKTSSQFQSIRITWNVFFNHRKVKMEINNNKSVTEPKFGFTCLHTGKPIFWHQVVMKQRAACIVRCHIRNAGRGNGNPVQDSCLENPHGQRSLGSTLHRVTQSQKRRKRLSTHTRRNKIPPVLGQRSQWAATTESYDPACAL